MTYDSSVINKHLALPGPLGFTATSFCGGLQPFNERIAGLLLTTNRDEVGCPHCLAGHTLDDRRLCACPTIGNGDMRCHRCGEMVNARCWNCGTVRGDGWCPNAPEAEQPRPQCDTCGDTERVPWMSEADPNGYQERDSEGMVPCPDCAIPRTYAAPPGLAEAIGARPEFVEPFRLPDMRERFAADGVSPPVMDGTDVYGVRVEPSGPVRLVSGWSVRREDVEGSDEVDVRATIADSIRRAAHEAMTAQFQPTGLVLHPLDHAQVGIDPSKPETIEHAKRIADAFDVPYWAVGIPGYRPPLRTRLRGRWHRAVRAVRDSPGRLPGVRRYYDPLDGWGSHPAPRRGPLWVRVGRWQIGHVCEDQW